MAGLLKAFGKGCLYILVLPVLLVILSVYIVLGIGMFLFVMVKGAILFFTGRSFGELPEDIKARAILEGTDDTNESVQIEDRKEETPSTSSPNDYASHYYVPLSQDIPAPKDPEPQEPQDTNKEGDTQNYKSNFGNPSLLSLILLYLFCL